MNHRWIGEARRPENPPDVRPEMIEVGTRKEAEDWKREKEALGCEVEIYPKPS